jgi:Protein of unknown function (DUF2637)
VSDGKVWAAFGFWVGIAASVSANVAHTFTERSHVIGAVLSAGFWPVALLIALEVIARVSWPPGVRWWIVRYGGLTTVALVAAIISYRHMAALLHVYGEDSFSAHIGPLAVDGLMIVCSAALLAIADVAKPNDDRPLIGRVELT